MSEAIPTCRIHEKYGWLKCSNSPLPGDPDGLCILHSQDKDKDRDAFKEAVCTRWEQANSERHDFSRVCFPGPFDPEDFFGSRKIPKAVDLSGATFMENVNFAQATFLEEVNFGGAIFKKGFFLGAATFEEEAYFHAAYFEEEALFVATKFKKGAYFFDVTFTKGANFLMAQIEGEVVFRRFNQPQDGEVASPVFQADFRLLRLGPGAVLSFQDLSLALCKFENSDLRRAEFRHVQWHSYRGRQAIYDELLVRQEEKTHFRHPLLYYQMPSSWTDRYGEVERLYRNLKMNYISEGDYKNAGDFHYGEMEMHRRASKWRWFPFYWYNLYRWLSGYGERPSWALAWLAVFLIGISGLIWGLGMEVGKPAHTNIAGFADSFIYVLQKATLQRPVWAEPMGFGGKMVAGLSVIFIPGQAALFLLALRNRLGRRR